MSNPSIKKDRVRDLPPVFIATVNGISPDVNGEVTLVVTTPIDPDSDNLLINSGSGLMVDKKASSHSFDTSGTTLVSTNVQGAISELDSRDISIQSQLGTSQSDIGNLQMNLGFVTNRVNAAESDIDALQTNMTTIFNTSVQSVSDSATINLTKNGIDISADVAIKSDIHNLIESTPNGIYADNKAESLSYSNLATSIVSNTVQGAIDEVSSQIDNVSISLQEISGGSIANLLIGEDISINDCIGIRSTLSLGSYNEAAVQTNQVITDVISQPIYGNGCLSNSVFIKLNGAQIYHYLPSLYTYFTMTVNIETDNGGQPSGILFSPSSTFNLVMSGQVDVTIPYVQPVEIPFSGFTIPYGQKCHLVFRDINIIDNTFIRGIFFNGGIIHDSAIVNGVSQGYSLVYKSETIGNPAFVYKLGTGAEGFLGVASGNYTKGAIEAVVIKNTITTVVNFPRGTSLYSNASSVINSSSGMYIGYSLGGNKAKLIDLYYYKGGSGPMYGSSPRITTTGIGDNNASYKFETSSGSTVGQVNIRNSSGESALTTWGSNTNGLKYTENIGAGSNMMSFFTNNTYSSNYISLEINPV